MFDCSDVYSSMLLEEAELLQDLTYAGIIRQDLVKAVSLGSR